MTLEHTQQAGGRKRARATQCFEPVDPILQMITLEMASRQQNNPQASKTTLFEDCVAAALGDKYPSQLRVPQPVAGFPPAPANSDRGQRTPQGGLKLLPKTGGVDSARAQTRPCHPVGSAANPGLKAYGQAIPLILSTPVSGIPGGDATMPKSPARPVAAQPGSLLHSKD